MVAATWIPTAAKEIREPTQIPGLRPKNGVNGIVAKLPTMVPTFKKELSSCWGVVLMAQPPADLGLLYPNTCKKPTMA